MNLNQRQLRLLKILFAENRFWTTDELAGKLLVSARTIKNDIPVLRKEIERFNLGIIAKRGKGICMLIQSSYGAKAMMQEISKSIYNLGGFRSEYQQRAFLIYRLIVNKTDYFTLEELAESLNLSRSVINQEMPEVKRRLRNFGLALISRPYYGMSLKGSEISIRASIIDSFEHGNEDISSKSYLEELNRMKFQDAVRIRQTITNVLLENRIQVMPVLLDRLTIAFYVSILRYSANKQIEEKFDWIKDSKMTALIEDICSQLALKLPFEEKAFLALYFLCLTFPKEDISKYYLNYYEKAQEIFQSLETYFAGEWGFEFSDLYLRKELFRIILQHSVISAYSIYSMYYTNEIREYARCNPIGLEFAVKASLFLHKKAKFLITRSLLYALTLFFDLYFSCFAVLEFKPVTIWLTGNFDMLSLAAYRRFITQKLFPFVKLAGCLESDQGADQESIIVAIDSLNITGRHVIHVGYDLKESVLTKRIVEKYLEISMPDKKLWMLSRREITVIEEEMTKKELFLMISGIFNHSVNHQLQTLEYLKSREELISYENQRNYLAVIPLFYQDQKGACLLRLKKPIQFKNWIVETVLVLSLQNDRKQLELYLRITKYMMTHYDDLLQQIKNLKQDENLFQKMMGMIME